MNGKNLELKKLYLYICTVCIHEQTSATNEEFVEDFGYTCSTKSINLFVCTFAILFYNIRHYYTAC